MVVTPYGEGLVLRTRPNGMREIELRDSHKQELPKTSGRPLKPTTLYSPTPFPSVPPQVGSDVICLYGRGKVTAIRKSDGIIVVRLSSWRLAQRSSVTCYLRPADVQVVRPKQTYEMSVVEKVERAAELKQQAAQQFKHKFYQQALQTYSRAVDTVKFVQHKTDSTNAVRADLVVIMVTCSNNAATCCSQLQQWDEAHQHAQHATALIDALERKTKEGVSKIHQELVSAGHSDIKVFGEWKVKSLLVAARALIEKGDELNEALGAIKTARETIANYTQQRSEFTATHLQSVKQLQSNDKELLKLTVACKEKRKAQVKKEKQRAQAMFGSSTSASKEQRSSSPVEEEKKTETPAMSQTDETKATPTVISTKPSLKKQSTSDDASSPRTVMTPSESSSNGCDGSSPQSPPKKRVSFADNNQEYEYNGKDRELVWHKDPAFLGGLGVVIGIAGTVMILSQLVGRPQKI